MNKDKSKPFVFVLMPFNRDFYDIYELGIKAACQNAGTYCERVDEQIYEESILKRIYNQIAHADIIVADMTNRNPNVFYETGYAHALSKRVVLLTQHVHDIPFDLMHYPHIIYRGEITFLKTELEKRMRWCIVNPAVPASQKPESESNKLESELANCDFVKYLQYNLSIEQLDDIAFSLTNANTVFDFVRLLSEEQN